MFKSGDEASAVLIRDLLNHGNFEATIRPFQIPGRQEVDHWEVWVPNADAASAMVNIEGLRLGGYLPAYIVRTFLRSRLFDQEDNYFVERRHDPTILANLVDVDMAEDVDDFGGDTPLYATSQLSECPAALLRPFADRLRQLADIHVEAIAGALRKIDDTANHLG